MFGRMDAQSQLKVVAVGSCEDKRSVNVSLLVIGSLDWVDNPLIVTHFQVAFKGSLPEVVVICSADRFLSMPIAQGTSGQAHLYRELVIDIHQEAVGRAGICSIDSLWRDDDFVLGGHGGRHRSHQKVHFYVVGNCF